MIGHGFLGNAGQYFWIGASKSSWPRSESTNAAVAVMGFDTEPRRYSVSAVAGTEFSRSAIPKPRDHTNSPFWTMATETPGTLLVAMNCEMAVSILACLSGEKVVVCPPAQLAAAKHVSGRSVVRILQRTLPGSLGTRR